jgi:hypothetical protein
MAEGQDYFQYWIETTWDLAMCCFVFVIESSVSLLEIQVCQLAPKCIHITFIWW